MHWERFTKITGLPPTFVMFLTLISRRDATSVVVRCAWGEPRTENTLRFPLRCLLSASFFVACSFTFLPGLSAETFSFTATGVGTGFSAIGTLTGVADPYTAGAFDLIGGSGSADGSAFSLVTPSGTSGTGPVNVTYSTAGDPFYYTYDNVVYTQGPALDLYGLLFSEANDHLNLFVQNGTSVYSNDASGANDFLINFTLTDTTAAGAAPTTITPEPSSLTLLGTGLLGTLNLLCRRRSA